MPSDLFDRATVAGAYLQPLLDAAAARGVAAHRLAQAAGLSAAQLTPLPPELPAAAYVRLLDAGAELAGDPHFGLHVGECVQLGSYHVYGLILLSCRDFGQALAQTLRFEALAHELGRSSLRTDGDCAEYVWHSAQPQASRHLAESVFAGIQVLGTWLAGRPLPPARIAFAHAAPPDCSEHRRIFGPEVSFGAPAHCARFDAALLSWPVRNADVGLYPVLQQHAEQLLRTKQRSRDDAALVVAARNAILRNLADDEARLAPVAEELGLTARTLQRKLAEAGISFQQLLDQTRYALACDYLRQPRLPLAEIALLLGYREQSSFTHAFKDWAGITPRAWRDQQRASSPVAGSDSV